MKRLVGSLAIFVIVVTVCMPAMAAITVGNSYHITDPSGGIYTGGEGPFLMTNTANSSDSFYTFCVERNEVFYPDTSHNYWVGSITEGSMLTNRELTGYSAWLYTMYQGYLAHPSSGAWNTPGNWNLPPDILSLLGTPAAPGTTANVIKANNMLQFGIWAGMVRENGTGVGGGPINDDAKKAEITWGEAGQGGVGPYYNSHYSGNPVGTYLDDYGLGTADFNASGWGGLDELGDVWILNIYGGNSFNTNPANRAQDQIAIVPGLRQEDNVPEPATLIIWSLLSLSGGLWAWARRRGAESLGGARQPWSEETRAAILKIVSQN
jgi:hypothetical protein